VEQHRRSLPQGRKLRVAVCGPYNAAAAELGPRYETTYDSSSADFYLKLGEFYCAEVKARGLGSAKEGTHHFWVQRVTAVALIPLTLWFVFSLARLPVADFDAVTWWVHAPSVAVALVLFLACALYHSMLGVQVVIEDYVAAEGTKIVALLLSKFVHTVAGVAGIFAVLKIALTAL
jgi:succinate dehydrogenase / fumarate reductase membrane anchor subunit